MSMENSQGRGNAIWVLGYGTVLLLLSLLVGVVQGAVQQHQVGGPPGWSLPSRANVNYTVWASTQTFKAGDSLYFNYSSANHNVLEVGKADYDSCNASNPVAQWATGTDVIPLNSSGTFYYICGIPGHCEAGQKVAVQVVGAETGTQHQVGGAPGWSLPSRANVNYTVWASTQTFVVGDTLYFNYSKANHNVVEVTEAKYAKCDDTDAIQQWDDGATIIALNKTGTFYYICGIPGHCDAGQKVAVPVLSNNGTATGLSPPTSAPSPGSSAALNSPLPISPLLSTLLPLSVIIIIMGALTH